MLNIILLPQADLYEQLNAAYVMGLQDTIKTLSTQATTCSVAFESEEIGQEIRETI